MKDDWIEKARRTGQAYINSFKGDQNAMNEDLRRRSKEEGRRVVARLPKPPRHRIRPTGMHEDSR